MSLGKIEREIEKVRKSFLETGSVRKAVEASRFLTPHEILRVLAEEKLKTLGFRIIDYSDVPPEIRRAGSPDIYAEKDGRWVLVEVKPIAQVERYSDIASKVVLVLNVRDAEKIEVWGWKELEEIFDHEFEIDEELVKRVRRAARELGIKI